MFPSDSLDWFRKHPLTATVAAVIAAAYSMAQYKTDDLEEPRALKSAAGQRGITWSDEKGGALTEIIKANGDSAGPGFGNNENVYTAPDERLYGSSESIESFGPPAASEEGQSQGEAVLQKVPSMSGSSSGESSPNFGWFVSFTPPQKLYVKKEDS